MNKIYLLVFLPLILFANIETKISGMNKKIAKTNKIYKTNYQEKKILEKKILKQRNNLRKINKQLSKLTKWLGNEKSRLKVKSKKLNKLMQKKALVQKDIEKIQADFIDHIAKNLSLILILNGEQMQDQEDIIEDYIFKIYASLTDQHIQTLLNKLSAGRKKISYYKKKLSSINKYILNIYKKTKKTTKLKQAQLKSIKLLNSKLDIYAKRIKRIKRSKNYLSLLLQKLKIQEKKKKRKHTAQTQSQTRKQKRKTYNNMANLNLNEPNINIRQINSSYQREKIFKYRGKKTIAPIKDFKILEKFGNSYDKIYNIKIFNRSIILKSMKKNQKVHTVLSGKVVFANDTPTLNKTIIIEHSGGIHTLYANLSRIAPQIKQGRYIKKGYVIGRISDELTFEVIKKDRYINPLDLIALK